MQIRRGWSDWSGVSFKYRRQMRCDANGAGALVPDSAVFALPSMPADFPL